MNNNNKSVLLIFVAFTLFFSLVTYFPFKKNILTKKDGNVSDEVMVSKQILSESNSPYTGLEFGHSGRIWVNDFSGSSKVLNGRGEVVKTKDGKGGMVPLDVKMEGNPTGQVFVDDDNILTDFMGDSFAFVTSQGKIYGWKKDKTTGLEPLSATLRFDSTSSNSVYSGSTVKKVGDKWRLYVTDSYNNRVDVFDDEYKKVNLGDNAFSDENLENGYSVYNIKSINDSLYVTYTGSGGGVVNVFDENGRFIRRLITNEDLDRPWGLAKAPGSFGEASNMLLVGNEGSGKIGVYDSKTGEFKKFIKDDKGNILKIEGLQALTFGTGNGAGRIGELFFTSSSTKSVFGKLSIVVGGVTESVTSELTEIQKIEKEFLEQGSQSIKYEELSKLIWDNCIQNCIERKLVEKEKELVTLYNKIFADAKIVEEEFLEQRIGDKKIEKLGVLEKTLSVQTPESFVEFQRNECRAYALSYFAENNQEDSVNLCRLYRTENWLKQLYILRAQYVRVELGPLGEVASSGKKPITESFIKLINEEEVGVERSY